MQCCGHEGYKLATTEKPGFAHDLAKMVQQVWENEGMPEGGVNKKVATAFYKELWSGITEGYGMDIGGLDYDTPDFNMLNSLQKDVYHFAAAKNYTQLKSLTEALIGTDGKVRSYSEFKTAAYAINDKHVNQWLKTEYNTAIGSAQAASGWVNIEANKDTLGILEFDAVMDSRTTEICSSLNGTRKPVDDPFWKIYYIPNHFGERSIIRQRSGGSITPDSSIVYPDIPEMFKVNLAEKGLAFPPKHPYFIGTPQHVLDSLID